MQFVSRSLRILWIVIATWLLFGASHSAAQGPDVKLEISGLQGSSYVEGEYDGEATVSTSSSYEGGQTTVYVMYRLADGTWPTPVTFWNMSQDLDERHAKHDLWKEQCPTQDCASEPLLAMPWPNECHRAEFVDQVEEACRGLSYEELELTRSNSFYFTPPPGTEEIRFHAEYFWIAEDTHDYLYAYDVLQPIRLADIPLPEETPPSEMTTVEPTTEVEPTAEPGQGVQISFRVEASGYEPIQTYMATEDYVPSSVEVSGYVRDQEGQAIPGATVTIELADGEVSETTDSNGFYRIYVETEGTKPLSVTRDWQLVKIPTAGNIQIDIPEIIWVPGETPLTITALDPAGKPLNKATAIITVVDPNNKPIPFLTVSEESGRWPDENGKLSTTIITRDPTDSIGNYVYAKDVPLKAKIQVEIKDREHTVSCGQAEAFRPFNLARIYGVTVGPDMEPRAEWEAPTVNVSKAMVLWREKDTKGNFWVVVKPLHPQQKIKPEVQWMLAWGFGDHLPLQYPLKTPPEPGEEMDVGKIDILTPEEHEARLTQIVGEFLIAMPLKPDARRGVWDNLYALTFAVDTSKDVPFYRDNALDSSGTVYYPDKPEDYWSQNLLEGNDPAYVIISHELGHFLHHALIERHSLRHFCYKFGVGLGHKTWQPPDLTIKKVDLAPQAAKEYTSFAESNADFFASLLIPFWLEHHPEMAESIYLQDLGYLAEFDTDEKAMGVVSAGTPGFIVEGVQTRFLRALYARYLADQPEWAYADYLATMWLYMEKPEHWTPSFLTRPARTITEWAQTKARLGSPIGLSTGDVLGLAEKYKVLKPPEPSPVGTYPVVLPLDTDVRPEVRIGSETVDFANWDLPAVRANVGEEIEVKRGAVALAPSGDRDGGTVVLKEKAKVILRDLATVEVQRGVVAIEGPVKAQTRNATVKPSGTVYVVEVTDSGETVVSTFDGEVVAESTTGDSHTLSAGEQVQVASDGTMGPVTTFDVLVAEKEVLPTQNLIMPFELQPLEDQSTTTVRPFGLGENRILLFAGALSGVLFALGAIGTGIAIMLPGGRDPALAGLVAQGKALRRQVQAGQVHPAQVQPLTGQDSRGRLWSLHPLQRQWQVWNGAAWQPARLPPVRQWGCVGAGVTMGALGLLGLLVVAPLMILGQSATTEVPAGATAVAVELPATSPPHPPTVVPGTVVPVTTGSDAAPTLTAPPSPRPTRTATPKPTLTPVVDSVPPVTPGPTAGEYDLYVKRLDYLPAGSDLVAGQPVQFRLMIVADIYPEQGPLFPASHFRWRPCLDLDWREGECPADTHYATCTPAFEFTYVEPGRYDVEVEVDTLDEVSETDEANNTLRLTLEVLQEPAPQLPSSTAEVTPAQLDADTARTLMPSAAELGIGSLPSLETTTFEVADYGEVTAFEFVDQSGMVVSLMVFDTGEAAAGFVEDQRSLYQTLGDTLVPAGMGHEGFVHTIGDSETEILVRVDRYILGTLGGAAPDQIRPAVERMAAFVSD